ncbi:MAG: hypothetical protein LZ172_00125 [Thaumarchaeota archaeon]|jgi:hypothetical protein|nr:hypothetical protein [Candidatus Geocrenenecus arthurdayi]MCL7388333.1 hypothetical protein [Candidatus Geocrenenecus arthurdayi]MCL7390469.1 hypothetical protein [Candidatus Geocrenenecus arthurdayi]MCL7395918.1 hypothetical protein [Candidatus Geocrenenecus arthurdayi]MCL7401521.1 hypothetical protein [Candidatus Geocrenenecus arthurdayi]
MRRRPTIEDIISSLLIDEGFYEISRNNGSMEVDSQLILSDGKVEIAVNILSEDSCNSRSMVHETLIETLKLQNKYDGVILAVPRRYSKIIDESVLVKYGVGLIIYDMMGAEEIIPPRLNNNRKEKVEDTRKNTQNTPINEIALLRSEVSRITRILEEMEARLDRLEREQRILASRISELEKTKPSIIGEERISQVVKSKASTYSSEEALPSYLRDNPWVDILSKRA